MVWGEGAGLVIVNALTHPRVLRALAGHAGLCHTGHRCTAVTYTARMDWTGCRGGVTLFPLPRETMPDLPSLKHPHPYPAQTQAEGSR